LDIDTLASGHPVGFYSNDSASNPTDGSFICRYSS